MDGVFAKYRINVEDGYRADWMVVVEWDVNENGVISASRGFDCDDVTRSLKRLFFRWCHYDSLDVRLESAVRKAVAFVMEREGVKATQAELTAKASEMFAKMIAEATKGAK